MSERVWQSVALGGVLGATLMGPVLAAPPQLPPPTAEQQAAPTDLRPLLAAPQSEMRLVVQRYTLDRSTLNGNYLTGGRDGGRGGRGGGRGGAQAGTTAPTTAPNTSVSVSPNRIARLKRFDLDWQAALGRIEARKLTSEAQADLSTLQQTIAANLKQLDADALAVAEVMPLLRFAPEIIAVV
jgi:hypothetical protein